MKGGEIPSLTNAFLYKEASRFGLSWKEVISSRLSISASI